MSKTAAEHIAEAFHDAYSSLAPLHGWTVQEVTRTTFQDLPDENRLLMVDVAATLIQDGVIEPGYAVKEVVDG